MENTKLNVMTETGESITIDVIDIFSLEGSDKEYILYSIGDDVYASILVEEETTFNLQTITDEEEMNHVKKRIEELVS